MRGGFRACGEVATAASADPVADALRAGNLEAEMYGSARTTDDPQTRIGALVAELAGIEMAGLTGRELGRVGNGPALPPS